MKKKDSNDTGVNDLRSGILLHIKSMRSSSSEELAKHFKVTKEGIRKQLIGLEKAGLIERSADRSASTGRPAARYSITETGENEFPKNYDNLALQLIEATRRKLGKPQLTKLLADVAEAKVASWKPRLGNLDLREKLEKLKDIYATDDPHIRIQRNGSEFLVIEDNCPFLNVAMREPAICSITVNTLRQLLGLDVSRIERFQSGDGRCVFKIGPRKVNTGDFELEGA
ncbi:MAG: DeoR family transcriptional regulator [Spirochaetia bacterium]|nr:DeoR family transcriptional regulator [Spirochaetia bacterium]